MLALRMRLAQFFSAPEVERLKTENGAISRERDSLASALKRANEKAAELQEKLIESKERESEALRESRESLKTVANYAVIAAGSRVAIFDGVGPTLPSSKYSEKRPDPIRGPMRASQVARLQNEQAIKEYLDHEQALADDLLKQEQATA